MRPGVASENLHNSGPQARYVTIRRSAKEKNMSSIKYDRLYSSSDGRSRVQKNLEIELAFRDFVPPAPPIGVSEFNAASTYAFLLVPAGFIVDWHPSPKRQWLFYLQGEMEYEAG